MRGDLFTSSLILGRRGAALAALCALLACGACVPTDDGSKNNDTITPIPRDMGEDQGASDMNPSADMRPTDMDAADMGGDQGGAGDMDPAADMAEDMGGSDMGPRVCMPNYDGKITRAEVPLRTGLYATYMAAADATVDLTGTVEGGERVWSLLGPYGGDHRTILEAREPGGQWFSEDFPDASYVARLGDSSELLGVFRLTDEALYLLGVVSPTEGFTETNVAYDPPVTVLSFPLEADKTWSDEASVSGTVQGVFSFYSEDYTSTVDAVGKLKTPFATFPVHRVRVELTRTVGFFTTKVITYAFVSECFGTVASVVSQDDEDELEFTSASEVRRLTP